MSAIEPLSLSPEDAAAYVGISLRGVYRLLSDKRITARRIGARTLIDGASLRAYYATLPAYVPGASMPNAPQTARRKKPARRTRH